MSVFALYRVPCLLLAAGLTAAHAVFADYQSVISLPCAGGELVIDARPYRAAGAGYSTPIVRYRYLGIELKALSADSYGYPQNIVPYLEKANPIIYNAGLSKDGRRHWQAAYFPKRGEILFLPSAQFTKKQLSSLLFCIQSKQGELLSAFKSVEISGRKSPITELEAGIALDGIGFLVYANFPLAAIYFDDWQVIFVEHDSRVLLHRHYDGKDSPPEVSVLGQVLPSQKSKDRLKLLLRPRSAEGHSGRADEKVWEKKLESLLNRQGERFVDNYQMLSR